MSASATQLASNSPPFARAVLVDRRPPTGRVMLRADAPPLLEIQATDNASGVAAMQVIVDDKAGDWQPYRSSVQITTTTAPGARLQVRLRDVAGNVSQPLSATNPIYLPLIVR